MSARSSKAELRERLRAGDPWAPGDVLDETSRGRMRRAMLAAIPERPGVWRPRPAAWVAAAVAAAMLALYFGPRAGHFSDPISSGPVAVAAGEPEPEPAAAAPRRQVQFTTAGGTRVIWTLDPDLEL